jgi:TPR repeat protein
LTRVRVAKAGFAVLEHELRKVADGGDIDAMNLLGSFLQSWGRPEEAAGWYGRAAEARAASTMLSGHALAFLHESSAIQGITNIRYEATVLSDVGHPGVTTPALIWGFDAQASRRVL